MRGEEYGLTMTAEEYRHKLEFPREPEFDPVTGEELKQGCLMRGGGEDGLCSGPCPGCAQERRRRAKENK